MYAFTILATAFLFVVGFYYWKDFQIAHDSIIVTGRVTQLLYGSGDHGSGAAPVVAYQYKGKEKLYVGSIYSNPPSVEVGEKVEMIISRQNPDKDILNQISERYFLIMVFGILGLVFGAIGYTGVYLTKR